DRLPVREADDDQQRGDRGPDRRRQAGRGQAGQDEDADDLLRRVRHRRQGVRGEHGQPRDLREPLAVGQPRRDRLPEQRLLGDAQQRLFRQGLASNLLLERTLRARDGPWLSRKRLGPATEVVNGSPAGAPVSSFYFTSQSIADYVSRRAPDRRQ